MSEDDGPPHSPPRDGLLSGDDAAPDDGPPHAPSGDSPPQAPPGDGLSAGGEGPADDEAGPIRRVRTATGGPLMVLRETAVSVAAVAAVGLLLFAISGVWPPMVAVESGSMEPHMQRGDLVFMTEPGRFAADAAHDGTGVVTREAGAGVDHWKFGGPGSVIVYDNPGSAGPPVIHRAQFWVEEGENWYDRANPDHVGADDCAAMQNCPAPNAGFVTKGDANAQYDQVNGISEPVKPEWIVGVARVRVPYLGWVRLGVSGAVLEVTSTTLPEGAVDPALEVALDSAVGPSADAGGTSFGNETTATRGDAWTHPSVEEEWATTTTRERPAAVA